MKKILLTLALLLGATSAFAQNSMSTTTCPGTGCVTLTVTGQATLGIQVTGTFSGTLVVQGSSDGVNFTTASGGTGNLNVYPFGSTTAQTSITGAQTGIYTVTVAGLRNVQISFSSYVSGTALVSSITSSARNLTTGLIIATSVSSSAFPLLAPNGTAGAPSYSWTNDTSTGWFRNASRDIEFSDNGTAAWRFLNGNLADLGAHTVTAGTAFIGPGTVAATGNVRLQNGFSGAVLWRNAGNTQDIGLTLDVTNTFSFAGGTAFPSGINLFTNSNSGLAITNTGNANIVGTSGGALQFSGIPAFFNNQFPPGISSGFGTSPSVPSNNGSVTFRVNVGGGGAATSGVINMNNAGTNGWNCQIVDSTTNIVTRQTANTTTTVTVTAASAWAANDILIFNCVAF